jgi:hypothetical protein
MSGNPWAEFADRQIASPRKARLRAAERLAAAREERAVLQRAWRTWRQERLTELLDGPHGMAAQALCKVLDDLKLDDGTLIAAVEAGPWRDADADTRFEILRLVDHAIIALRERNGLPPFDDPLPFGDGPPMAFQVIREHLR